MAICTYIKALAFVGQTICFFTIGKWDRAERTFSFSYIKGLQSTRLCEHSVLIKGTDCVRTNLLFFIS